MVWVKLTSKTLTSTTGSITTDSFTSKNFNQILLHNFRIATPDYETIQLSGNTNPVYADRYRRNGGTEFTQASQSMQLVNSSDDIDEFYIGYVCATTGQEKLTTAFRVGISTSGAPNRDEIVNKFVPSPDSGVTIVKSTSHDGLGTWETNSNLTVTGTTNGEVLAENKITTGCEFHETDTNKDYVYNGSSWVYITP